MAFLLPECSGESTAAMSVSCVRYRCDVYEFHVNSTTVASSEIYTPNLVFLAALTPYNQSLTSPMQGSHMNSNGISVMEKNSGLRQWARITYIWPIMVPEYGFRGTVWTIGKQ